jgi:hypothetical protein
MGRFLMRFPVLKQFPPYPLLIVVIGGVVLSITALPATDWWNSGLYAAAAYSLGIPGPGDSILFVLMGRAAIMVFPWLPAIQAIVLVNIAATIGVALFLYFSLLGIFSSLQSGRSDGVASLCAFTAAVSFPFLYSVWSNAVSVSGYALGLLLSSSLLFLSVKLCREPDVRLRMRFFLLAAYIMGLDFAAHRLNNPFLPVLIVIGIVTLRKNLLNWRFVIAVTLLFLAGFSLHVYLLIRGNLNPDVDQGFIVSWHDVVSWIRMDQKGQGGSNLAILFQRRAPLVAYQINHMYLRYLGWNFFGRNFHFTHNLLNYGVLIPGLLGISGALYFFRKKTKAAIVFLFAFLTSSLFLVFYLNIWNNFFRDIDRLFLASFLLFHVWVGIGVYAAVNFGIKKLSSAHGKPVFPAVLLALMVIIAVPVNVIVSNWRWCDRSGYFYAEDWAYNLLQSCDQSAILFTNGDNDTYPLWFCQTVAGIRKDVTVVNCALLNLPRYASHLRRYLPDVFAGISDAELYGLAHSLNRIEHDTVMTLPRTGLTIGCPGKSKTPFTTISDQLFIRLIEENNWKHPVYLAITCNPEDWMRFHPYVSLCGLAYKLCPEKQQDLNISESERLCMHVFRYRNIDNPSVWTEKNGREIECAVEIFKNYRYILTMLYRFYLNEAPNSFKAEETRNFMHRKIPDWRFTPAQLRDIEQWSGMQHKDE